MTIQSISVPGSSVEHVNALIASLPRATTDLAFFLSQEQGVTADIANAFLKAFEQNLSLESFLLIPPNPHKLNCQLSDIMKQVERIVVLNRAGRCILSSRTPDHVPRSLWPRSLAHILAKSRKNADVIYFLLCENPQLF
jgi:hypothetical protein